jgi:hypothetical protein
MNFMRFNELMTEFGPKLGQHFMEWQLFLEFACGYFKARRVEAPVVVEIGTMRNVQKHFYRELLGAEHIGIDPAGNADIVGRSQAPETRLKLVTMLRGRPIDLLFIDGDHTYRAVKADYEIYSPLTRHIVALHDISHPWSPKIPEETMRLWSEIQAAERTRAMVSVRCWNAATTGISAGRQMGIGILMMGG